MNDNSLILKLDQSCDNAVNWVVDRFSQEGLTVIRTFDLQAARQAQFIYPCPHHGTELCDCQMVVLLIYGENRDPVTLIAHGYNNQTWFSLVDTPQQRADPRVETTIRQITALALPICK
jgi:hypothetical protein